MADLVISSLPVITTATTDDVLILNDSNSTTTRLPLVICCLLLSTLAEPSPLLLSRLTEILTLVYGAQVPTPWLSVPVVPLASILTLLVLLVSTKLHLAPLTLEQTTWLSVTPWTWVITV